MKCFSMACLNSFNLPEPKIVVVFEASKPCFVEKAVRLPGYLTLLFF